MRFRGVTDDEQASLDRLGPSRPLLQLGWFITSVMLMCLCASMWYWIVDQLLLARLFRL